VYSVHPAFEDGTDTGFRNIGQLPSKAGCTVYTQLLNMELIQGSETSANYNLTPGKYPKENIQ